MHTKEIEYIIRKEFGCEPGGIVRMSNGLCNEVYKVDAGTREVFVRLNRARRYPYGSHNHIPIFKARGIVVPEILAEDYSQTEMEFAYQVISKLPATQQR